MANGGLRITTGIYGGRMLRTPVNHRLRPTRDKVRQAAFSMLLGYMPELADKVVMDLFCGSGALGIEALSRGAKWVGMVDMYPQHVLENAENLKLPTEDFGVFRKNALNFRVEDKRALRAGSMCPAEHIDLIIADPPYDLGLAPKLLTKAQKLGKEGSIWMLETEDTLKLPKIMKEDEIQGFEILKDRTYGSNTVWILRQVQDF